MESEYTFQHFNNIGFPYLNFNYLTVDTCFLSAFSFRLVPFLTELRAVMDWVWTDTTLSLSNWMCVEDIYANIFIIKCSRETEKV